MRTFPLTPFLLVALGMPLVVACAPKHGDAATPASPASAPAASAGVSAPARLPASAPASAAAPAPVPLPEGAYHARLEWSGHPPAEARPGAEITLGVKVTNLSPVAFPGGDAAADPRGAVLLAYHILPATGGAPVVFDGLRTPLGGPLPAGQSRTLAMKVKLPDAPGDYRIEVDLVHEGVTWFSERKATVTIALHLKVLS